MSGETYPGSASKENTSVARAAIYTTRPSALPRLKKAGQLAGIDSISVESARFLVCNDRLKSAVEDGVEFEPDPVNIDLELIETENIIIIKEVPVNLRSSIKVEKEGDSSGDDRDDSCYNLSERGISDEIIDQCCNTRCFCDPGL